MINSGSSWNIFGSKGGQNIKLGKVITQFWGVPGIFGVVRSAFGTRPGLEKDVSESTIQPGGRAYRSK